MNLIYASRLSVILISTVLWSHTYASTASIRCKNGVVEYLKCSYKIQFMIRLPPEHVDGESISFLGSLLDSILVENIRVHTLAEVSTEVSTVSENQTFPALRKSSMRQSTYLNFRKIIDFSVGCRNVNSLRKLDISRLITDVLSNINITGELLRELRFSGREEFVNARELTMMSQSIIWENDVDSTTGPLFGIIFRNTNGDGTRASDGEVYAVESRHFPTLRYFVYMSVAGVAIVGLIGLMSWKSKKDNRATKERPVPEAANDDDGARENPDDSIISQTEYQRSLGKKIKTPTYKTSSFYVKPNHADSQQHVCGNNLNIGPSFDRLHKPLKCLQKTLKRKKALSKFSKRNGHDLVGAVVNVEKNIEISSLGWRTYGEATAVGGDNDENRKHGKHAASARSSEELEKKMGRHDARVVDRGKKLRLEKLPPTELRQNDDGTVEDRCAAIVVPFNFTSLACCSGLSDRYNVKTLDDIDGGITLDEIDSRLTVISYE